MIQEYLQQISQLRNGQKPEGWLYSCIEEFVLKNGREFKVILPVKKGRMKACYQTATSHAHIDSPHYVEGFALVDNCLPVLHAWNVNDKGEVLDYTWGRGKEYFGVVFNFRYLTKILCEKKTYGLIDAYDIDYPLLSGRDQQFKKV